MTQTPSSTGAAGYTSPPAVTTSDPTTDRGTALKQDAGEVAGTARQGASDVAQQAGTQAREVAGEAKDHARELLGQATSEVRTHANEQAERAAGGLEQLASRVQALVAGRPEEAGPLRDYAVQLGDRAQRAAEQLRTRGADGVLTDVRSFARRRPGAFLAGAAAAGFMVGRLIKAQRASSNGDSFPSGSSRRSDAGTAWAGAPELPVYGTAPGTVTELSTGQPYPTPVGGGYPAGVDGIREEERRP